MILHTNKPRMVIGIFHHLRQNRRPATGRKISARRRFQLVAVKLHVHLEAVPVPLG